MRTEPDPIPTSASERSPEAGETVISVADSLGSDLRQSPAGPVGQEGASNGKSALGRLNGAAPSGGHAVDPLLENLRGLNGLSTNGHPVNGSSLNGSSANGHSLNGHGLNGIALNGAHALHPTIDAMVAWDDFLPTRSKERRWSLGQRVKRVFDVVVASLTILVLSPLLLAAAIVVRLTSRGPVLYVCDYVGYRGRRFPGFKFRTMVHNAETKKSDLMHLNHMDGPAFKIREDPRVTQVGAFLRKYSIDELPQLWNVIRGDMSLVGPRPPLPEEWVQFAPWQRGKLAVIPGITCYWQVSGRSDITSFDEWARLDLAYIEDWSLGTDLKILTRTIPAVLKGDGAY